MTDHEPIKYIRTKKEFGSNRVQRWIERFSLFRFDVKYVPGTEVIQSDNLSRIIPDDVQKEQEQEIMIIHEESGQRKKLRDSVEKGLNKKVSNALIRKVISKCKSCAKKDVSRYKSANYVEVDRPGERFGVDLMEVYRKYIIAVGIDYFSRMLFARLIPSEESNNTEWFLDEVYKEFKMETVQSDNGGEFDNSRVRKWCDRNCVIQKLTIPHYHQGNGRLERVIRTLRAALKRTSGPLKQKLPKVVAAYNASKHRGIDMPPEEALKPENWALVKQAEMKYRKELKNKPIQQFYPGNAVLIRNENKRSKIDAEFKDIGTVKEVINRDTYIIEKNGGKFLRRHGSQLRIWPRDVGVRK